MSDAGFYWSLGEGVPGDLGALAVTPESPDARVFEDGEAICDGYRVVGILGRGASGVVYRAHEPGTEREVAIKLLSPDCEPVLRERLLREGQIVAGLDHPGIGRVFSAGDWEGHPYLVYELLEGCRTLEEAWPTLSPAEGAEIVRALAEALGHAHRRGVVHRDVKPDNVLLDRDGAPRVIDFGHARDPGRSRLTSDGALIGTPLYMAPEAFDDAEGSPAGDVWSLGVILHRALTGRLPFDAVSLHELAAQVCNLEPAALHGFTTELPAACAEVTRRALQPELGRRYPDAGALAADLRRALDGATLQGRPGGSRGWVALALALALALVLALVGAFGPGSPEPMAPERSPSAATAPAPPVLAAVDAAVARGAFSEARRLLDGADARWASELRSRRELLTELARELPRGSRLRDLPPGWLAPIGEDLLARAELDVALATRLAPPTWVRRRGDPDPTATPQPIGWFLELGLQPEDRHARAEGLLELAQGLPLGSLGIARVQRAARQLARLVETDRWAAEAPAGRAEAGAILQILGAHRGGYVTYWEGRPAEEWLEEAVSLDMDCWPAHYIRGRQASRAGGLTGLQRCVEASERCPRLMRYLHYDLRAWSALDGGEVLRRTREVYVGEQPLDPLVRIALGAGAIEFEGDEALLATVAAEADAYLERDPASLLARSLRAFLALRQGRLEVCRQDIALLREALAEAPLVEFVDALLRMREGASEAEVLRALRAARDADYRGITSLGLSELRASDYPECEPYLSSPEVRRYFPN